jgi:16S rRNA (cytosine1402-N4)-methyltransferase
MTSPSLHTPVLLQEVLESLAVRPGGQWVDCTTGLGGHSEAIATAMGPEGRLLCIDQDREALEFARARLAPFGRRVSFVHANFRELAEVAAAHGFSAVDGVLMDLGVSSMQLQRAERGFAFSLDGPLDMRMDREGDGLTAADIVNGWPEADLADVLWRYGEERQARRIAAAIVRARPLRTTWDLARTVEQAVGARGGPTHIHPATRAFLALRVRVNGELDSLESVLPLACRLLGVRTASHPGGRLSIISFHSLEDRVVKQFLHREARDCVCPPGLPECRCGHRASLRLISRRGVRPTGEEVAANPRARSAILRAAERIA